MISVRRPSGPCYPPRGTQFFGRNILRRCVYVDIGIASKSDTAKGRLVLRVFNLRIPTAWIKSLAGAHLVPLSLGCCSLRGLGTVSFEPLANPKARWIVLVKLLGSLLGAVGHLLPHWPQVTHLCCLD